MKNLSLVLAVVLISSCSNRMLMTKSAIDKYKISDEDMMSLQFYATSDVVLNRYEPSTTEKSTEKGALSVSSGQQIEQVIISRGTKGKCVQIMEEGKLVISFEPDDSKFLFFGKKATSEALFLQALEWKDGRGKVQYGENIFYTSPGAENCSLSFKLKREFKEDREVRKAKGNKVK